MKSFTVIGFFEDNGQVWCEHVKAEAAYEAMQKAVKLLKGRDNENVPDDNMAVVGVFAGRRMEISESWAVSKPIVTVTTSPGFGWCESWSV